MSTRAKASWAVSKSRPPLYQSVITGGVRVVESAVSQSGVVIWEFVNTVCSTSTSDVSVRVRNRYRGSS